MRLCFGFVCEFVYICVLFSVLLYFIVFYLFVFFVLSCVSSTPNEDIVRFRCGGSHIPFFGLFLWNFQFLLNFFLVLGLFVPFLLVFCLYWLGCYLYISKMCMIRRLTIVWFSTFHDNSASHVLCCACLVHLNIDLWCWTLKFGFRTFYLVIWLSFFSFQKKKRKMCQKKQNLTPAPPFGI